MRFTQRDASASWRFDNPIADGHNHVGGKPILDVPEHFDDTAAFSVKNCKEQGLKFSMPAVYSFMHCHGEK